MDPRTWIRIKTSQIGTQGVAYTLAKWLAHQLADSRPCSAPLGGFPQSYRNEKYNGEVYRKH